SPRFLRDTCWNGVIALSGAPTVPCCAPRLSFPLATRFVWNSRAATLTPASSACERGRKMAPKQPLPGPKPGEAPNFEQAMERLEAIVQELESGELTLDESLARYEEGTRLSKRLSKELDEAERRIESLSMEGDPPTTSPMDLPLEPGAPRKAGGE